MKRIIAFALLLCMLLSISACAGKKSAEVTTQELYDASNIATLLEKHENVYIVRTENGEACNEEYYSKDCNYFLYSGKAYGLEYDNAFFTTDHSYYFYADNNYVRAVPLSPDGMVDMKDSFAEESKINVFSPELLNDVITSVTKKDGQIIVTTVSDQEELDSIEGLISCEEELVLDAKTRELVSIKTVWTYEDGVLESASTFTYDVEIPEKMKVFLEYDQQTENMRTITVISNPGTANEKTESIQSPKGLIVGLTPDAAHADKFFTMYADAACTQLYESEPDLNSDVTVYLKWDEQQAQ